MTINYGHFWIMKAKLVSEFKTHCVQLLNEVADSGEELLVTKRGVPLARVLPVTPSTPGFREPGDCVDSVSFTGDIVYSDSTSEWESLTE